MIPIAVIWFGIGETSKYFLIFWGTFFIVLINTTAGVMRAPVIRQRAAQCLGASELQIFLLVVIPSAAPYIVTGMRIAMASSFMSIIPAEILAADSGIGFLLRQEADVPIGGHSLGRALHRHRDAHRDGVFVHEHHTGGDPGGRFGHRLPAAAGSRC